jgi:hypothetical protein
MTGIPRKQVQAIRNSQPFKTAEPRRLLSPLADLLHIWATSPEYLDEFGLPRPLAMEAVGEESFSSLVRSCMGDVPPGAARAELQRLGVVSIDSNGDLRLTRRSLIPDDASTRLESAIEYSLRGLAKTIAHNVDPDISESTRYFERFVESRPMSESEIESVRDALSKRLVEVSEELDASLNSAKNSEDVSHARRVGIGLYYTE